MYIGGKKKGFLNVCSVWLAMVFPKLCMAVQMLFQNQLQNNHRAPGNVSWIWIYNLSLCLPLTLKPPYLSLSQLSPIWPLHTLVIALPAILLGLLLMTRFLNLKMAFWGYISSHKLKNLHFSFRLSFFQIKDYPFIIPFHFCSYFDVLGFLFVIFFSILRVSQERSQLLIFSKNI